MFELRPRSSYGAANATAYWLEANYREAYGMRRAATRELFRLISAEMAKAGAP
jgi:GDP-D-mannose dehydratase